MNLKFLILYQLCQSRTAICSVCGDMSYGSDLTGDRCFVLDILEIIWFCKLSFYMTEIPFTGVINMKKRDRHILYFIK